MHRKYKGQISCVSSATAHAKKQNEKKQNKKNQILLEFNTRLLEQTINEA